MSKQIDEKIVSMQFDNRQFEQGVKTSMDTLNRLQQTLKNSESIQGFKELSRAANNVDLSGLERSVGSLESRFSVMGIAGMTAVQNITTSVMTGVANLTRKVGGMIVSGGISRSMNIEQAKFQLEGLKVAWKDIEDDIMFGVDKTAYGLDAAAIAASQLYASNVKLGDSIRTIKDESTGETKKLDSMAVALKAISGVAAMTNSDYQSIASIFTTVAGQGQLMTMQLRQLESRGLNVAAKLGEVLGKSEAEVRDMVTKGKINFEMFSTAMYDAFGEHASEANRTLTGVIANVKSALSKIGAKFIQPLIENSGPLVGMFDQLRMRLNDVKDNIDPIANVWLNFANKFIKSKTDMLKNLDLVTPTKALSNVFEGLGNILDGLLPIIKVVKIAFREIFPKKSSEEIISITESFKKMTESFRISTDVLDTIKNVCITFFGALRSIGTIAFNIFEVVSNFIFELSTTISSFISNKDVNKFSDVLSKIGESIKKFFGNFNVDFSGVKEKVSEVTGFVGPFASFISAFAIALGGAFSVVKALAKGVVKVVHFVCDGIKNALSAIVDALNGGNLSKALNSTMFAVVLYNLKNVFLQLRKLIWKHNPLDTFKNISDGFDQLRDTLFKWEQNLHANYFVTIGAAILMLAISMSMLADIDAGKLATSLGAISVLFIELTAVMKKLSMLNIDKKMAKSTGSMVKSLITMSFALLILATAVEKLGTLDLDQLAKGLGGVTVLLGELTGVMLILSNKLGDKMIKGAGSLIFMAVALRILVGAVEPLGRLDYETLIKGLLSVVTLMFSMASFAMLTDGKKLLSVGVGLMGVAEAIKILASAAKMFGELSVEELIKAGVSIGSLLLVLGIFAKATKGSAKMVAVGVSMVLLGTSMKIFASAAKSFGDIEWSGLAKAGLALTGIVVAMTLFSKFVNPVKLLASSVAMIAMGTALGIFAIAAKGFASMEWSELGKAALALSGICVAVGLFSKFCGNPQLLLASTGMLVMAAALALLVPPLVLLGSMSVSEIIKSLLALAGAFVVIGGLGAVLGLVSPLILAFSASLAVLGVAMLAIGGGALMLSTAISALCVSLATGGASLTAGIANILEQIVDLIPTIAGKLGEGFVTCLKAIADKASTVADVAITLISKFLETVRTLFPQLVEIGFELLLSLLNGINNNIKEIISIALSIIANFIKGIADGLPKVIDAGYDLIIAFINGLADTIDKKTPELIEAMSKLGDSMLHALLMVITGGNKDFADAGVNLIRGFKDGIQSMISEAVDAVNNLGSKVITKLKNVLDIHSPSREAYKIAEFFNQGFINGLNRTSGGVENAASNVGLAAMMALSKVSDAIQNGIDATPVIRPVIDLSDVRSGVSSIGSMFGSQYELATSVGSISAMMNGRALQATNDDVVSALSKLRKDIANIQGNTYNIDGITYDDGSNVASAIETLVRAARVERRV